MNTQTNLYKIEEELEDSGYHYICGIDEVGRGSLAGPIVVTAIIMPLDFRIDGINDSKKLTDKKRRELYKVIKKNALAISTIYINNEEVDELNVYQATKLGMIKAIKKLKIEPDYVLVDAMPLGNLGIKYESLIHGDARSASIAAASIIAKVTRDDYMIKMDFKYPNYGFARHKGYCTKKHVLALETYGPTEIHRKTFYPVSKYYIEDRQLMFDFNTDEEAK